MEASKALIYFSNTDYTHVQAFFHVYYQVYLPLAFLEHLSEHHQIIRREHVHKHIPCLT